MFMVVTSARPAVVQALLWIGPAQPPVVSQLEPVVNHQHRRHVTVARDEWPMARQRFLWRYFRRPQVRRA